VQHDLSLNINLKFETSQGGSFLFIILNTKPQE